MHLVASEANELSEKEKKNTIMPEHVVSALESLGFSAFSAEVGAALEAWKAEDKASSSARSKLKSKDTGMSDEEALAAQQKLFADARARMQGAPSVVPGA